MSSRPKTTRDAQRKELERLLKNPNKEIVIPGKRLLKRTLSPPPEIVSNVPSSSAGAGSGEFHVYKAARRKEFERLKIFEEEARDEAAQKEFETKQNEFSKKNEERLSKNRQRRQKRKQKVMAKKENKTSSGNSKEQNETLSVSEPEKYSESNQPENKPESSTKDHEEPPDAKIISEPKGLLIVDDDEF